MNSEPGFSAYMQAARTNRRLVVQPRMGFSTLSVMRCGLQAVRDVDAAPRIGTLTVDAYTRVGNIAQASAALRAGQDLNGFPIVSHGGCATRQMLSGLRDMTFPVQVRHGSPFPKAIFEAAAKSGVDAIEGGPVSYNLPYSRAPLSETVSAWQDACRGWAAHGDAARVAAHMETFGGCMLGQLCPPSLLITMSVLEGLFFVENGIRSLSLSLTQGTSTDQDVGGLLALQQLAERYFSNQDWHIVFYTFMGLFPQTAVGAERLIRASAHVAVTGGAHRLIVKTVNEAHGIPTVEQNLNALQWARYEADAAETRPNANALQWASVIFDEADQIIRAAIACGSSVGSALVNAFANGILDIPYCSHPSNANVARAAVDTDSGALVWLQTGSMPLSEVKRRASVGALNAAQFHTTLNFNRAYFDQNR